MLDFGLPLPYSVEYNGRVYKLTPAYDNVINMYQALMGDLLEHEKIDLIKYYLFDEDEKNIDIGAINAAINVLFPKPSRNQETKKVFDFYQDAPYIYSAFLQAYHLDLFEERGKLHWLKFSALLSSIPDNTKLSQIMQIRMAEIPKPTKYNGDLRAKLIKQKQMYALEVSDNERQMALKNGFLKIFFALNAMAQKGGNGGRASNI